MCVLFNAKILEAAADFSCCGVPHTAFPVGHIKCTLDIIRILQYNNKYKQTAKYTCILQNNSQLFRMHHKTKAPTVHQTEHTQVQAVKKRSGFACQQVKNYNENLNYCPMLQ